MDRIRIALADDHAVLRTATSRVLAHYTDFEIVGEAADGREAVELAERLHPDVLICDLRMPQMDGLEVIRRCKESAPGTRVLVLSAYDEKEYVLAALKAGASGYLMKTVGLEELAQSIRTAHLGQTVLHPRAVEQLTALCDFNRPPAPALERLSPREVDILRLAAAGHDNAAISAKLQLSVRTVEGHLGHIYTKLGVSSRIEAIQMMADHGLDR